MHLAQHTCKGCLSTLVGASNDKDALRTFQVKIIGNNLNTPAMQLLREGEIKRRFCTNTIIID